MFIALNGYFTGLGSSAKIDEYYINISNIVYIKEIDLQHAQLFLNGNSEPAFIVCGEESVLKIKTKIF